MLKDKVVKGAKDDSAIEQLPNDNSSLEIIPILNEGQAHEISDDENRENPVPEKEREEKNHVHEYKSPIGDQNTVPEEQQATQKQNSKAETLKKEGSYNEKNPVSKDNAKIKK